MPKPGPYIPPFVVGLATPRTPRPGHRGHALCQVRKHLQQMSCKCRNHFPNPTLRPRAAEFSPFVGVSQWLYQAWPRTFACQISLHLEHQFPFTGLRFFESPLSEAEQGRASVRGSRLPAALSFPTKPLVLLDLQSCACRDLAGLCRDPPAHKPASQSNNVCKGWSGVILSLRGVFSCRLFVTFEESM